MMVSFEHTRLHLNLSVLGIYITLLIVVAPTAGQTESLKLRSGEHPGFSRLVIDFVQPPDWVLEGDETSYRLVLDGPEVNIDTSQVFNTMSRRRIVEVRAGLNQLRLKLACSCSVSVFDLPGSRLVIDVRDRPSVKSTLLAGRNTTGPLQQTTGYARSEVLNEGLQDEPSTVSLEILEKLPPNQIDFDPVHQPALLSRSDQLARDSAPSSLLGVDLDLPPVLQTAEPNFAPDTVWFEGLASNVLSPFGRTESIGEASKALIAALDRASDLGLVDELEAHDSRGPIRQTDRPPPGAPLPLPIGNGSSLRVSTSLDRDLARIADTLGDQASSSGCLAEYDLSIDMWGDPDAPMNGFTRLRQNLFGEFDTPDIEAARILVQNYIYLSFGAEAKAILATFPFEEQEKAVLSFLAEIADGQVRNIENEASALLGCEGRVAIWALLSIPDVSNTTEVSKSEIAATFSALPLHLRKRYGPTLVQRFLQMDDPGTARLIWNSVDRVDKAQSEEFVLASAKLAEANGEIEAAERAFALLEGGSPKNAPKAVLRLLQSRLDRGAAIDPGLVETAAALSFENRGTPLARALKFEELRGRTALGQWDTVFEELPTAEFSGALSSRDAQVLLAEHFAAIASYADIGVFLTRGFQATERLPIGPEMDVARRLVADRLISLGFGSEALSLLTALDEPNENDTLSAASADLAGGAFQSAVTRLVGVDLTVANQLRGVALERLGRLEDAQQAFMQAGDTERTNRVVQRAGDWTNSSGEVSDAAFLVLSNTSASAETPLAQNRALVFSAQTLRNAVANLRLATVDLSARYE